VITWLTPMIGQSMGYFIVATVFAIPFIYGVHRLTKSAKPYDPVQTKESAACLPTVTVGDMVKSVVTNGQLLVVILSYTMFYSGMFAFNTVMAYYFIYVLGNFLLMSVALTAVTVFALFASIIGPKIGVRIGKKRAMVFGQLIYAIGALCIALFGQISLVLYIAINCVMSVGMYMFSSFSVIYMLDAGEYGFYKTGKDNRTVGMSMMNIPMKIGMAVGGAVGGFGLASIGFSTGMTVTASFISNFMWLLGGIPAAFYLLGSIVMAIGYRITDADAALYAKENAERVAKLMENC
jgi:Na+/melibiose symporter-like transporter